MKKILLLFVLISGFAFAQVARDLPYQNYFDKDLSKMKMEIIFTELLSEKKISLINADKDSYDLQIMGDLKLKMFVEFYDKRMTFTFSDFSILQDGKRVKVPKEYENEISDDYFNIFKSAYYNNLN